MYAFAGGLQEIVQDAPQLLRPASLGLGQIDLGVLDGAFQDEQPVPDRLELGPRDHQLVLAQTELEPALTSLVVALAARLPAVQTRSTRPSRHPKRASAPSAPVLRHSDDITGRCTGPRGFVSVVSAPCAVARLSSSR